MAKTPKPPTNVIGVNTPEGAAGAPPESILWSPNPGPQTEVLIRPEFEIFFGGAKGGGKSFAMIGWLMKGNPYVPMDRATPVDLTYLNCPDYRALVIRRNLEDLNSWIAEAYKVYSKLGANYTQKPNEFTFPTGAKIIVGHLDDEHAAEKYFGNVVHRAAVDELTFIPLLESYMKLFSCVRSNIQGLKAQMLLTGNPGGPGTAWVMERFVEPLDANGRIIPPRTRIVERHWNPFTKRDEEMDRVFIPSTLKDNPKMIETDPLYYNRLAILPLAQRKAYLEGDWHAEGTFFDTFRPVKRDYEPPEAMHVVTTGSRPILPWLPRFAGCDWGFGHAAVVYGAVRDLNGQTIVHRELVLQNTGSVELGAAIGRLFLPDLEAMYTAGVTPVMNLWLSPDAFAKRDVVKTQAEGIAEGIGRILGSKAAHLPELFNVAPVLTTYPDINLFGSFQMQQRCGIVISQAQNARKAGAAHLREMLRWEQVAPVDGNVFDPEIATRLMSESAAKWRIYMEAFKSRAPEVLPKLLIDSSCKHLIQSIPTLVADKKDIEDVLKTEALGDDVYDAWRYLLFSPDVLEGREPQRSFVQRHLDKVREMEPNVDFNSLVWAARQAEAEYGKKNVGKPFNVPLESNRNYRRGRVH